MQMLPGAAETVPMCVSLEVPKYLSAPNFVAAV